MDVDSLLKIDNGMRSSVVPEVFLDLQAGFGRVDAGHTSPVVAEHGHDDRGDGYGQQGAHQSVGLLLAVRPLELSGRGKVESGQTETLRQGILDEVGPTAGEHRRPVKIGRWPRGRHRSSIRLAQGRVRFCVCRGPG